MKRFTLALALIFSGIWLSAFGQETTPPAAPLVYQIRLSGEAINPGTERYIGRAIRQAETDKAACLVLMLDTPGGLLSSTREIVKKILHSQVPVVVYVAPSGSRAASAGVFITMAGHVAAMAPGTNIGAAHPAQVGGLPGTTPPKDNGEEKQRTVMEEKILSDTVAWARSLAKLRQRNEDWIARAVEKSESVDAAEAVEAGAVDLVAVDVPELLRHIDGREVQLPDRTATLRTANAVVHPLEMWWGETLLVHLANPNLALLLLVLGFYGIMFELSSPGWGVGGVLGTVCLLLGFFSLAILPVNLVGLALVFLGLGLFVAEVFVTSYGTLALGGIICLVLGGTMLVDSPVGFQAVSLTVVIPLAVATGLIMSFLVGSIVRAHRGQVQTGVERLKGIQAIAAEDFSAQDGVYSGVVRIHGEMWRAVSSAPVAAGQVVEVKEQEGLTLHV